MSSFLCVLVHICFVGARPASLIMDLVRRFTCVSFLCVLVHICFVGARPASLIMDLVSLNNTIAHKHNQLTYVTDQE